MASLLNVGAFVLLALASVFVVAYVAFRRLAERALDEMYGERD